MEKSELVKLSLDHVCEGTLNQEFLDLMPRLIAACKEGGKSSVNITITLSQIEDMKTMFSMSHKIKPVFPSKDRKAVCYVVDNDFMTEAAKTQLTIEDIRANQLTLDGDSNAKAAHA